jgi:hypothetical protein
VRAARGEHCDIVEQNFLDFEPDLEGHWGDVRLAVGVAGPAGDRLHPRAASQGTMRQRSGSNRLRLRLLGLLVAGDVVLRGRADLVVALTAGATVGEDSAGFRKD